MGHVGESFGDIRGVLNFQSVAELDQSVKRCSVHSVQQMRDVAIDDGSQSFGFDLLGEEVDEVGVVLALAS